jgi:hypothetical protein
MDIVAMAIQMEGAREGQSFVLIILQLNLGKLFLLDITNPIAKKYAHYQTKQIALYLILLFVMHHESISCA